MNNTDSHAHAHRRVAAPRPFGWIGRVLDWSQDRFGGVRNSRIVQMVMLLWAMAGLGLLFLAFPATAQGLNSGAAAAWSVLGAGFFLEAASMVVGSLAGFLFGVPRRRAGSGNEKGHPAGSYEPNTNLEQVSDWLTKIIIGIGLTQFPAGVSALATLGAEVGPIFGASPLGPTIAVTVVIFYLLLGFFHGFLLASLWLPRAFDDAARAMDGSGESTFRVAVVEATLDGTPVDASSESDRSLVERRATVGGAQLPSTTTQPG